MALNERSGHTLFAERLKQRIDSATQRTFTSPSELSKRYSELYDCSALLNRARSWNDPAIDTDTLQTQIDSAFAAWTADCRSPVGRAHVLRACNYGRTPPAESAEWSLLGIRTRIVSSRGHVILAAYSAPHWDSTMRPGSHWLLYVPSWLARGQAGRPHLQPDAHWATPPLTATTATGGGNRSE